MTLCNKTNLTFSHRLIKNLQLIISKDFKTNLCYVTEKILNWYFIFLDANENTLEAFYVIHVSKKVLLFLYTIKTMNFPDIKKIISRKGYSLVDSNICKRFSDVFTVPVFFLISLSFIITDISWIYSEPDYHF